MNLPQTTGVVSVNQTTGVVSVNSLAYVRTLFDSQERGQLTVPLRSVEDKERLAQVPVDQVLTPEAGGGFARFASPGRTEADRLLQVLFTSGTTGAAKAIALTAQNVHSTIERLNAVMELTADVREYIGVPVHYSFGLGRVRAVTAVGGEVFVPEQGFNPSEIADLLRQGRINALSVVPTLVRVLLQNRELFEGCAANLRWIEIGSQHMTAQEKLELRQLFANAKIVQHYGLTEASRTTFLRIHEASPADLDSVGPAEHPVAVRLDAEGRIQIRGPHVARHALSRGEFLPLTDAEGWLTTNDLGAFRGALLLFQGRADDVVNCGGIKLYPETLEPLIAARLPSGVTVAVGRTADALRGDGIVVAYESAAVVESSVVQKAAAAVLAEFGVQAAGALAVRQLERLPRTESGKVRRSALAEAAPRVVTPSLPAASAASGQPDLQERLLAIWREVLRAPNLGVNESFYDVGGDSLTAIAVALRMEKAGLEKRVTRGIFLGKTIAQLASEARPSVKAAVQPAAATPGTGAAVSAAAAPAAPGNPAPIPVPPQDQASEHAAVEQRLLAIWSEVLGGVTLTAHDSFYDVGGDSLTAVTVALRMERAGLEKKLARGVFQGKTIAQLARESVAKRASLPGTGQSVAPSTNAAAPRPSQPNGVPAAQPNRVAGSLSAAQPPAAAYSAPVVVSASMPNASLGVASAPRLGGVKLAALTEATNLVRGIVILCILSSHWLPIFFQLSPALKHYAFVLHPLFNLGSPTLAVVFGLSVSLYYSRQAERNWASFLRNVRTGTWLTSGGVLIYVLIELASRYVRGEGIEAAELLVLLCGPLLYYALATASLPLWIRLVRNELSRIWEFLFAAVVLYGVYLVLHRLETRLFAGGGHATHALQMLLLGKWGLPQMASLSLGGTALGLVFERRLTGERDLAQFWMPGLLMIATGGLLSLAGGKPGVWFVFPRNSDLWSIVSYTGVIVAAVGCHGRYWAKLEQITWVRKTVHWVSTLGIALFPLFVVQSLVYHSSVMLMQLTGWQHPFALGACVAVFLAVVAYPLNRIHKLYYSDL